MLFGRKKLEIPSSDEALAGRGDTMPLPATHFVLGTDLRPEVAGDLEQAMFGMGCFWGAERMFWESPGVVTTAVGYAAGSTPNPSYEEVCSGMTGHNEVVWVVFDRTSTTYGEMLSVFWDNHDPTQGMRQGNDVGTQYRSGIYTYSEDQQQLAEASRERFQPILTAGGYGPVTTEIITAPPLYFAEHYHQQYLAKVPNGYCGIGGTGLSCPIGVATSD